MSYHHTTGGAEGEGGSLEGLGRTRAEESEAVDTEVDCQHSRPSHRRSPTLHRIALVIRNDRQRLLNTPQLIPLSSLTTWTNAHSLTHAMSDSRSYPLNS